jgi:hypothetical protein
MEERRFTVSLDDIEADFHQLVDLVDETPARFVFNGNEPSDQTGDEVPFTVPGSGTRTIPVVCPGADEPLLKPLIVLQRKTINTDVALTGLFQDFNTAAMERPLETHQL